MITHSDTTSGTTAVHQKVIIDRKSGKPDACSRINALLSSRAMLPRCTEAFKSKFHGKLMM